MDSSSKLIQNIDELMGIIDTFDIQKAVSSSIPQQIEHKQAYYEIKTEKQPPFPDLSPIQLQL